jgi:hypothetical protein
MWSAYGDGDGPDEDALRRMSAPENELPATLPVSVLLARTDDLAVGLIGLQVYSTGLTFELAVRVRPSAVGAVGRSLQELFWDHPPHSATRFLLGIELGDGRRVTNLRADADGVVFHQGGGGGGDTSVDQEWWLSPLPPEGPLRVVVRCDELGLAETVTELDGSAIRAAAADVLELWPWEPPSGFRTPQPPPPPDVPPDSWFGSS